MSLEQGPHGHTGSSPNGRTLEPVTHVLPPPALTELLLPIVPQQQQLRVEGHLTEVLRRLPPGLLLFLSSRRWGFGQKPIFLLRKQTEMRRTVPCNY